MQQNGPHSIILEVFYYFTMLPYAIKRAISIINVNETRLNVAFVYI